MPRADARSRNVFSWVYGRTINHKEEGPMNSHVGGTTVVAYEYPREAPRSDRCFVRVNGAPVFVYQTAISPFAAFSCDGPVIVSSFAAFFAVMGLAWALSYLAPAAIRGAFTGVAFIGNLSYMGFPLAANAYGATGLTFAGIINAFLMPAITVAAVMFFARDSHGSAHPLRQVRRALFAPVILAAIAGLLCSLVFHEVPAGRAFLRLPGVPTLLGIADAVLRPLGSMGLPLSLIAVGAALRFSHIRAYLRPVIWAAVLKLAVMPAAALAVCLLFFPGAGVAAAGTSVLLMACPVAVAAYVLGDQLKADSEYIAAVLAVTTVASCVTIPVWVAVLMAVLR